VTLVSSHLEALAYNRGEISSVESVGASRAGCGGAHNGTFQDEA